jgi:hypothetical protein
MRREKDCGTTRSEFASIFPENFFRKIAVLLLARLPASEVFGDGVDFAPGLVYNPQSVGMLFIRTILWEH